MLRRLLASLFVVAAAAAALGGALLVHYGRRYDAVVQEKFSGRRWDLPSKVHGEAPLVYPGVDIDALALEARLERLRYRRTGGEVQFEGEYTRHPGLLTLYQRTFQDPSGAHPARLYRLHLRGSVVERIDTGADDDEIYSLAVEPETLAGLYVDTWEERRILTLDKVPATLVNAILSTEDQRFFEHGGIDPRGIARAFFANLAAGRVVQGGSTLTQQLMKNFFLTEERTGGRKLREAVMAIVAERRYSKREILENYLNEIYLGQNGAQGIFGVWEASRFYFRKEPNALSLAESALLAGLLTGPSHYNPYRHPERALRRRDAVLRLMHERGLISDGELDEALASPLGVGESPPATTSVNAPYFVDHLRRELAETYPPEVIAAEGLNIASALDPQMQRAAQEALEQGLAELERRYPRLRREGAPLQGCLVAIQPQTGEIKAMVGGRDYQQSQFNRCTQALRQPGSIFKPFTFAAALDHPPGEGVNAVTWIEDEPFTWTWEGRPWSPRNYGNDYRGRVSVRQALEQSLNAATARLAEQAGLERIRDLAQRMGIRSDLPLYPSLVLGAVEVTPMEVAEAYAVLANQGLRASPLAVRAVVDRQGEILERKPMRAERALDPAVAYVVTHLLEGVLDRGTGGGARGRGFQRRAAGKTGTTNDARDVWFAGFTADLLAVVWVGFDDNSPLGLSGSQAALPIWTEFMKMATRAQPDRGFTPPPGVTLIRIDPLTGGRATAGCKVTFEEAFLEGDGPSEPCPLHDDGGEPTSPPASPSGREPA